ncbi:hypothetical protein BDAP_002677 [Binucleata daphniae]
MMNRCISNQDPEIHNLINKERERQSANLELIASENYTYVSVLQANSSILTNKYSEGYPGRRYYGGTHVIDEIEMLCQKRALQLFNLNENEWGVNVQALSGSPANFAVYTALIGPNGKLMGLDLPCGGHLTHGYQSKTRKVSATSLFFNSSPYTLGADNLLDYDIVNEKFSNFLPNIFVCGASAYPRDFDYKKLREICDTNNTYLMADIAHISGFVATKKMNNPFEYCDIVTTTTHKTLRGPRGALIFYKKKKTVAGVTIDIEGKINAAVFPGLQGGPHNQTIAAIAVALKHAMTDEYKQYMENVKINSQHMAEILVQKGYKVITGGTDCHIVLFDVTHTGFNGTFVEKICEVVRLTVNKNALPSDVSALNPSGIRIGSCALTTRGLKKEDFTTVIEIFDVAINIAMQISEELQTTNQDTIMSAFTENETVKHLQDMVDAITKRYPLHFFDYVCQKGE